MKQIKLFGWQISALLKLGWNHPVGRAYENKVQKLINKYTGSGNQIGD